MDEQINEQPRTPVRRRRRKSKLQIFKEAYLPIIIAGLAVVMILIFIIGSVSRSVGKHKEERESSIQASQEAVNAAKLLDEEARNLLEEAEYLAAGYDMEGAIAVLDSFSGNLEDFPDLADKRAEYAAAQSQMTEYSDLSAIPNLSFQLLIADPARAFVDAEYGSSYQRNFITVTEFSNILQALYDNGYVLVGLRDMITTTTAEDGSTVYATKSLYLPADKKPVMLTETQVNYYTFMTDGDGDGKADQNGAGFASRMVLDTSGNVTTEYISADGTVSTGAYDLVPILEAFIAEHPDFSLRGARATLAVTGYDGLFGYRTNAGAKDTLGEDTYNQEVADATQIAEALRASGYELACYTYDNMSYGDAGATEIAADLQHWTDEVTPILGNLDILVYARNSDISDTSTEYSGDKYNTLYNTGFRIYLGTSSSGSPWASVTDSYVRQNRIAVTGADLVNNPQIYADLFDATAVVDSARTSD